MKREEYEAANKPEGRKSILAPYLADIRKLRSQGYSLNQVIEYLRLNDVTISVRGLTAYLARHKTAPAGTSPTHSPTHPASADEPTVKQEEASNHASEETTHNPTKLNAIFGQQTNLDELIRRRKKK